MATKKILHIIPSLIEGGAERLALDICIELSKRANIDVVLVALNRKNDYPQLSSQLNYQVIPSKFIPSIKGKPIIETAELMQFIHNFQPDVIHSHLFEAELASRHKVLKGVKYFTHCHDNMRQLKKFSIQVLKSKVAFTDFYERKLLLKRYEECNNSFIAISKHTQNYFIENLPKQFHPRIYLQHNAIHFQRFHAAYCSRKSKPLKLINVGTFVAKKNQAFLVEIVQALVQKNVPVHLTMLGEGALRKTVEQKIKTLGLSEYITMPGNVENVPEYLKDANIYVHSATYEPFGLVLIEAMAAGLPVVSLDGGGNRDIMENGKNGYLISDQNAEKFANTILTIADNENTYEQMSKYSVEFAQKFDIKNYVDKLLVLYDR